MKFALAWPGWLPQTLAISLSFTVVHSTTAATSGPKKFSSPEDAVRSLEAAASAKDTNALATIFGPEFHDIVSPDPVETQNELSDFATAIAASNRLERMEPSRYILKTGTNLWPFPVPLVREGYVWYFDTPAGKDEILNRRIGENELTALQSVRAYVDAQREYASRDRDGSGVLKYAQRILSSPNSKDGLYWPADSENDLSPLGPLIAKAQTQGYLVPQGDTNTAPRPYHGYYYRILKKQGKHAPGGKYDYVINGNMIGGFGLIAWPAEYGVSGIMTFIVNQQGKVFQRDLGPKTADIVKNIQTYDPDSSWRLSHD